MVPSLSSLVPDVPRIHADMFTGILDNVATQMLDAAESAVDAMMAPLSTADNMIQGMYNTADATYVSALSAAEVAKWVSPGIYFKLRRVAEQAEQYRDRIHDWKEKFDDRLDVIFTRVNELKELVRNTVKHSIEWIEWQINKALDKIYKCVDGALQWLMDRMTKWEEKLQKREEEIEKKVQDKLEQRAKEIAEAKAESAKNVTARKNRGKKKISEIPKTVT